MRASLLIHTPEQELDEMVFGVDEVGRGCLAGPVVAACVAFDWKNFDALRDLDAHVRICDSKLLSRARRKEASAAIQEVACTWGFGVVDASTIDEINILQATFEAMRRAVHGRRDGPSGRLDDASARFFIDGNKTVPGVDWHQEAIIDGDAKVFSIAAASIIAKEYRDTLMEKLHEAYPQYGFAQHKGYGTRAHYAAIAEHGMILEHRRTFLRGVGT